MAFAASARADGSESWRCGSSRRPSSGRWRRPSPRMASRWRRVSELRRAVRSGSQPFGPVPRASSATSSPWRASVLTVGSVGVWAAPDRAVRVTARQRAIREPGGNLGSVRRGGLRRSTSASMPLFITPGKMTPLSIRIPVAALILSIRAAGCSSHHESIRTTPEPTTAAQSQQAAIAKAHADSLRHPYVQADVDFMTGMIGHHAQAIVMAGWAPTHGASPSVRILCRADHQRAAGRDRHDADVAPRPEQPVPEAKPGTMR